MVEQTLILQIQPISTQVFCDVLLMRFVLFVTTPTHEHSSPANFKQFGVSPESLNNSFANVPISSHHLDGVVRNARCHWSAEQLNRVRVDTVPRTHQVHVVCHVVQEGSSRLELGIGIGDVALNLPSSNTAISTCPNERIGFPNAVRTPAYSFITWTHRFAIPFRHPFSQLLRHSAQPTSRARSPDCASTM